MYTLNALLWRMKYIPRWSLMRATREENLCEHTADCAHTAHMLALLSKNNFGTDARPEAVAVASLYHDASEILTGDMPTPVKYKNSELKSAYKALEYASAQSLCQCAPPTVRDELYGLLMQTELSELEKKLLKAADRICALIKCIEEERSGNREFAGAKAQQLLAIKDMHCPEAEYFLEHMLPCYENTLDELSSSF